MNKIAAPLLTFLLFSGIVNAQWVLNNGNYLQSIGTNKIGVGVLPGIYPGKVNIAAQSTEPHIWLFGGPTISTGNLSSKFNINSSSSANLGIITSNSIGGGGLGILEGPYVVSPVVWMYNSTTGNNAFTVGRVNYNANGISDIENNFNALLQVRENGNVGIGTNNPSSRLHVKDGVVTSSNLSFDNINARLDGRDLPAIKFTRWTGTGNTLYNASVGQFKNMAAGGDYSLGLGTGVSTSGDQNATSNAITILSNGKVGIGTQVPSQLLTVNGTVYSKEVKVDLNAGTGPDYVFEKDYALPSLESVKTYIDQNKHLPEVPSAKEMEANGINLSEMNMLLLKKVEELTLYVIEQQKQIDELKKKQ